MNSVQYQTSEYTDDEANEALDMIAAGMYDLPSDLPESDRLKAMVSATTIDEKNLCKILGVSRRTLLRWRRTRGFPEPIKLFRINRYDLLSLFKWEAS